MDWYSLRHNSVGVLTLETIWRGWEAIRKMDDGPEPVMYLDPVTVDRYRKLLARHNWKRVHREYRMFRVACEMGWLNGRL